VVLEGLLAPLPLACLCLLVAPLSPLLPLVVVLLALLLVLRTGGVDEPAAPVGGWGWGWGWLAAPLLGTLLLAVELVELVRRCGTMRRARTDETDDADALDAAPKLGREGRGGGASLLWPETAPTPPLATDASSVLLALWAATSIRLTGPVVRDVMLDLLRCTSLVVAMASCMTSSVNTNRISPSAGMAGVESLPDDTTVASTESASPPSPPSPFPLCRDTMDDAVVDAPRCVTLP